MVVILIILTGFLAKLTHANLYFAFRCLIMMQTYKYERTFVLECGKSLPCITIAYNTYGKLNADKSNVVWVCHALTANSDAADWWPGVVGEKSFINPDKYFIVCANIIGSCYGSTGPSAINPETSNRITATFH